MKTLLQINASLFSSHGQSSTLNTDFARAWLAAHPGGKVVVRDFSVSPMPHLTAERFQSFLAKPEDRNAVQREIIEFSDALIAEIRAADEIVIGVPMYNFGIPSMLQSYFDHIARAGVTFRYTETGPVGLLTGKKAYVFTTRGGVHAGTSRDAQISQVRHFLGLLGITEVEVVYAEGLSMGDIVKAPSLAAARSRAAVLLDSAANDQETLVPSTPLAQAA
ncbi:MAG: NAD(P)H-dependent oxidoreductase [Betaproteobacteria bacterium]